MKKPYFARWLPVKGKIKVGDKFNSISGEIPGKEHVRLFLCSRDIQVGDEVKFTKFNGLGDAIIKSIDLNTGMCWTIKDKFIEKHDTFKIIGEILTVGIKEGQEFTEKETEYLTIGETNT